MDTNAPHSMRFSRLPSGADGSSSVGAKRNQRRLDRPAMRIPVASILGHQTGRRKVLAWRCHGDHLIGYISDLIPIAIGRGHRTPGNENRC